MEHIIFDLLIIIGNLICAVQPNNNIKWLNYLSIILLVVAILVRVMAKVIGINT